MLENRLIKKWQPAGNRKLKRTDRHVFLRCRLDIPYPVLEVAAEPAGGQRRERRAAAAAGRSRPSWPTSSPRSTGCATAGARCSCASTRPPTGRWAAACRPASATSTPTPTGASWTWRSASSRARSRAGGCSSEIDRRIARGLRRPALRARRRAAAPPRAARLAARAPRGHPARHPRGAAADAGAPPGQAALRRLLDRARAARRLGAAARPLRARRAHRRPRSPGSARRARPVPAAEVDELRIVWGWLAEHEPPELPLDPAPDAARAAAASWRPRPPRRVRPYGALAQRTYAPTEVDCVPPRATTSHPVGTEPGVSGTGSEWRSDPKYRASESPRRAAPRGNFARLAGGIGLYGFVGAGEDVRAFATTTPVVG